MAAGGGAEPPTGRSLLTDVLIGAVVIAVIAAAIWGLPALTGGSASPSPSPAGSAGAQPSEVAAASESAVASVRRERRPRRLRASVPLPGPTQLPGGPFASSGAMVVLGADGALTLVAADGRATPLAPADDNPVAFPAWSPDGTRIAAIRLGAGEQRDRRLRRPRGGDRERRRADGHPPQLDDRAVLPVVVAGRPDRVLPGRGAERPVAPPRSGGRQRADRRQRSRVAGPQRQPVLLRLDRLGPAPRPCRDRRGRVPRRDAPRRHRGGTRAGDTRQLPAAGREQRRRVDRLRPCGGHRRRPVERRHREARRQRRADDARVRDGVRRLLADGAPRRVDRPHGGDRRARSTSRSGRSASSTRRPARRGPCSTARSSATGGARTARRSPRSWSSRPARAARPPRARSAAAGSAAPSLSATQLPAAGSPEPAASPAPSASPAPQEVRVVFVDATSGAIQAGAVVEPGRLFVDQYLTYFDQYATSHQLWAPDSSSILIPVDDATGSHLRLVPRAGGTAKLLDGVMGAWSP